jgi:5-methylcytosine-specific restriction endonuclease McrA
VLVLPVLLLNRFFAPVSVTTARRAMVLLFGGAALALDDDGETHDCSCWRSLPVRSSDDVIPIVGGELRVPRVLHLLRYDRAPRIVVRLTRRNLMLRDEHQCQYCGRRPSLRDLNLDHVVPRSRGGKDSWDNLVVSCRQCNLRKGRRTPEEAGMRLLRTPQQPRWTTPAQILLAEREPFSEWQPYLKAG